MVSVSAVLSQWKGGQSGLDSQIGNRSLPHLCVWYQSPTGYGEKEAWAGQTALYLLFFCPAQLVCVQGMNAGIHDKNTGLVWAKGHWKWSL